MTEVRAPIEFRDAAIAGVNFAQRTIDVIAVPYDQETKIVYRGEVWDESFAPGSFDGIEKRPNRVKANRDHDKRRTVGKAMHLYPGRPEGLVTELRIAKTDLGDETLALADEEILGASVGVAVLGRDQQLDKANRKRRILRAFLDHIALTPDPAYEGAKVLAVREGDAPINAADLPKLVTPALDELLAWHRSRAKR